MKNNFKLLSSKVNNCVEIVNDYFGIDDKEIALWFYCGLGFPILCGVFTLLVSVALN
ncbi:hypothetical protein [Carnobacterium maltaromaticum]|uniref:hypothetical protein n=1 Tax=Carnobacterium maltaromaticum TaxID=2751 RepID=UPI0028931AD3|nr:hypothetical protein [Carnobacterium maltaromaticum]